LGVGVVLGRLVSWEWGGGVLGWGQISSDHTVFRLNNFGLHCTQFHPDMSF